MARKTYDLVITDMRRQGEPAGDAAGIELLDQMVRDGIPTPAIIFTNRPVAAVHPRAAIVTTNPEDLVDGVVDLVGDRRSRDAAQPRFRWGRH